MIRRYDPTGRDVTNRKTRIRSREVTLVRPAQLSDSLSKQREQISKPATAIGFDAAYFE